MVVFVVISFVVLLVSQSSFFPTAIVGWILTSSIECRVVASGARAGMHFVVAAGGDCVCLVIDEIFAGRPRSLVAFSTEDP